MSHAKENSEAPRLPWAEIGAWVAAAFLFRVVFLWVLDRVVDSADAIHYLGVAKAFAAGAFTEWDATIPVLYPGLVALASAVLGDLETAGRVVSLLASSLLVVPVYLLALRLFGRNTARVSAAFLIIWPWLVDYGSRIAPEAVAVTLWFTALLCLARCVRSGRWWIAAAVAAFLALHLVRPEGFFLWLVTPGAVAILCWRDERARWTRLVPFVLASVGCLVAYALFMRYAAGEATLSYRVRDPAATVNFLLERSADIVRTFRTLAFDVFPVMIGPYLLVFAGVGLFAPSKRARDLRLELMVGFFCGAQFGLAVLSAHAEPRYLMPIVVAALVWAARGIAIVTRQAQGLPYGRWLAPLPLLGLVFLGLLGNAFTLLPEYTGPMPQQSREYKYAGQWMKANLEPGLVITRKPQVGFYADMPTVGPEPDFTVADVVARAHKGDARYVVIDERYTAQLVPGLRALLDPANAPPELSLLRDDLSPYEGARIVVYAVVPGS
jgi:4-amino-4-deoxy-L-arabinose transferase-like glycosyltransferase